MSIRDAGDAIAYLPNLSQDLGQSDVEDAKPKIAASNLADALTNLLTSENTGHNRARCHTGLVLEQLPQEDRALLARLIDEPRDDGSMVPATYIATVLQSSGYKVNPLSIRRHRRRRTTSDGCTCA